MKDKRAGSDLRLFGPWIMCSETPSNDGPLPAFEQRASEGDGQLFGLWRR